MLLANVLRPHSTLLKRVSHRRLIAVPAMSVTEREFRSTWMRGLQAVGGSRLSAPDARRVTAAFAPCRCFDVEILFVLQQKIRRTPGAYVCVIDACFVRSTVGRTYRRERDRERKGERSFGASAMAVCWLTRFHSRSRRILRRTRENEELMLFSRHRITATRLTL